MPAKNRGKRLWRNCRDLKEKFLNAKYRGFAAPIPEPPIGFLYRGNQVGKEELRATAQQHLNRRLPNGSAVENMGMTNVLEVLP